ncbi:MULTISPECIES: cytochrome P460 family protein [Bradyrhizobium]|uniref:cytochrome P460 family protein n=1 Tax=Bradyrhizobium TaxID=374 RepID=UPI000400F31E|nr:MULTISPECIES: cytochrome P460 family protein [Bradyrhizobium]QOG21566.1 cytochrome C [Bradyrhizobium sp. SEMIA]UFW52009.1 cytochrome P460 family protein [Bradyrhizobium arachidis]
MKILKAACIAFVVILGITSAVWQLQMRANAADGVSPGASVADRDGHLHVPDDYRTTYQLLGSWAIAGEDGHGSKEVHVVYASPGVIDAYRRDKRFPNGAVLIKEVFNAATSEMTTGTVSRADTLKGWFVMVKDTANSHPESALWGDGWGWSWFDAGDRSKTTTTNYRAQCLACHVPARASDWVYVDGYPPLKH